MQRLRNSLGKYVHNYMSTAKDYIYLKRKIEIDRFLSGHVTRPI
jgi:hypothetical protein